ncbi:transcriptional regulator [Halobacteriales archaeon QH_6_66_25]|nr:MAG: transcriptional regulator [Halobacteriales archaeon QH_6_66_25]
MSAEDSSDGERGENVDGNDPDDTSPGAETGSRVDIDSAEVRERLEQEADRAVEQFDESIVDLLSWLLDTETRARIFVHLRQHPNSTSDEIAEGTGLYPSTVREALAGLHDEGTVTRQKRQNDGAGNNPYEYSAIPPSELVGDVVEEVQSQLNTVFNLDSYIDRSRDAETEPVTITVRDETDVDESAPTGREDSAAEPDSADDGTEGSDGGDDADGSADADDSTDADNSTNADDSTDAE